MGPATESISASKGNGSSFSYVAATSAANNGISNRHKIIGPITKNGKTMPRSIDYQEYFLGVLKDPRESAAYLEAAAEDGEPELFLLALRNVVEALGGVTQVAEMAGLDRSHVYRMLSKNGNPRIANLFALLNAVGVSFAVKQNQGKESALPVKQKSAMVAKDKVRKDRVPKGRTGGRRSTRRAKAAG